MATIYNMAGTTSHSFKLGDGTTIFYGLADPLNDMGNVGDIYVRMTKKMSNELDFDDVDSYENLLNYPNYYEQEEGHPLPINSIVRLIVDENNSSYYQWIDNNGTLEWQKLFDDSEPMGRIYYKEAYGDSSRWNFVKSYSFDTDVIHAIETSLNSNDFKIAIEYADTNSNNIDLTTTPTTDYDVNKAAYGVTRYGTDTEVVASEIQNYQSVDVGNNLPKNFDKNTTTHKFEDKFIGMTPEQVGKNIKVEMTRAIKTEGTLNNLNSPEFDSYKTDLVTAINHENTRAKTVEGTLTDLNFYNDVSWTGTKNLVTAINFENTRATTVEGDITTLKTDNKTNLVNAINSELDARIYGDNDLQRQIDAITSKSDVVDIVQCYDRGSDTTKTDIVHYDTSALGDDDIIKVLDDETHDDTVAYWRFNRVPEEAIVTVATKAALDAYDTSHLQADDISIVTTDESHSNQKTYYKLTVNGSTRTWEYQGVVSESWSYVGSVEAYYTVAQADAFFVHKTAGNYQNETIVGEKTFSSNILRTGAFSGTEDVVIKDTDSSSPSKGSIESDALYTSSKIYNRTKATNSTANKNGYLDVAVSDTGIGTLSVGGSVSSWSNNTASNSTTSNDVALIGWVNDPSKSTNVVHRTGDESIAGTKTFSTTPIVGTLAASDNSTKAASTAYVTSAISTKDALVVHLTGDESISGTKTITGTIAATGGTVNVATQTQGDNSTKAASTAYVDTGLSGKFDKADAPTPGSSVNGQFIVCTEDPDNPGTYIYDWKVVKDITTLGGLDDTEISSESNGQVLLYNGSKWVNGSQVTATIKYW